MASDAELKRAILDLAGRDGNKVPNPRPRFCRATRAAYFCDASVSFPTGLHRLRSAEPAVGVRELRRVFLPRLLRTAPFSRRTLKLRPIRYNGQVVPGASEENGGLLVVTGRPLLNIIFGLTHAERQYVAGNKRALEFFRTQPDYQEGMSIRDKYSSRFADLWRQKVAAEAEGKKWVAPPASSSPTTGRSIAPSPVVSRASGTSSPAFGLAGSTSRASATASPAFGSTGNTNFPPAEVAAGGGMGDSHASDKARNEAYFAAMGSANM
ncbi:MAG: hypothetical protein BJ554DRAFT_7828, partial [Olpidium bornovanus]